VTRILTLLAAFLLSACGSIPDVRNEYQGPDAGRVAIDIGASANTHYSSYSLNFRKVGDKDAEPNRFVYFQHNEFSAQKKDYDNSEENGVVQSFRLPPGEYEIFNFDIFLNGGTVQKNFGSRKEFSIPFKVRSNETTYLGNYQANLVMGTNFFGMSMAAGAVFVVADREKVDIELAKKRLSNVAFGPISNATPTAQSIANPFFVAPSEKPLPPK
jgi:hypothetical protein